MNESFDWLGPEPTPYHFYGNTQTLYFDEKAHQYFRYVDDEVVFVPGVTTVCGVYDKSAALMQWAANQCAEYISAGLDANPSADYAEIKGWLDKARFAHKEYKENAADIGHIAHEWIEQYINACIRSRRLLSGDEYQVQPPANERAANGVSAALSWMAAHNVTWLFTERKTFSLRYGYAGTKDGLALIDSCGNPECCGTWERVDGRWIRKALSFVNALVLIDWKTSNNLHDTYSWQTAAYLKSLEEEIGVNGHTPELPVPIAYRIIIRLGKDDGMFESRLLTNDTLERDFQIFLNCLELYNSVAAMEEEDKQRRREIRQQEKEDRALALKIKCPKADKYKGKKGPPRCNGTDESCETCLRKYEQRQSDRKSRDLPGGHDLVHSGDEVMEDVCEQTQAS